MVVRTRRRNSSVFSFSTRASWRRPSAPCALARLLTVITHLRALLSSGGSELSFTGFQSWHIPSLALRFVYPIKKSACSPLEPPHAFQFSSSCSIYTCSIRWQRTTSCSVRSVVITSRVLLYSCLQRQRARVRGGDEPQRHRKRQRGAKRNHQGLKLWRVS
jgi:hypothetical protein